MKRLIILLFLFFPGTLFANFGGGGGFSKADSEDSLKEIKQTIEDQKYADAIKMIKKHIKKDANSADAYNYLGFSYRKSGNLPEAFKAYDKALALDPKHLGAHEYLGEAYLMNKEPEKANEMLKRLKELCGNCEEYLDLEKAIAADKR